jgi:hypothetical protein
VSVKQIKLLLVDGTRRADNGGDHQLDRARALSFWSDLADLWKFAAPWLCLGENEENPRASDNALDTVISAPGGRSVALGLTEQPRDRDLALTAGQIYVPHQPVLEPR